VSALPEFISLGAGVQSSCLLFMADKGLIKPLPKRAIFADTQCEPDIVYRWLKFMREHVKNIPITSVTAGNLGEDSLKIKISKAGVSYLDLGIPLFVKTETGSGILNRSCTKDYKIRVVANEIKHELTTSIRISKLMGVLAKVWIGISFDEEERKRPNQIRWLTSRWPLLEEGMTREDCLLWMKENHYPVPPRSSCVMCPYHSDATWLDLKTKHPDDFAKAVAWERDIQEALGKQQNLEGKAYCHNSLVPLGEVIFDRNQKRDKFNRTCEGMCGV
jgi:hypothetical protein